MTPLNQNFSKGEDGGKRTALCTALENLVPRLSFSACYVIIKLQQPEIILRKHKENASGETYKQ